MNAALLAPNLIRSVVADSFNGRTLADDFSKNLIKERIFAKNDPNAKQFYEWCQGDDWERVVDLNTNALIECAKKKLPLFPKPLESLRIPILFLGSKEDTMCRADMIEEYTQMNRLVQNGAIHIFEYGDHPAIASNAEAAAEIITAFINQH